MNIMLIEYLEHLTGQSLREYHEVINSAFEKKNLRGLKEALTDNISWVKDFYKNDNPEIEHILKNTDFSDNYKLNKILSKDSINSNSEYSFILNYLDNNFSSIGDIEIVKKCNKLLIDFEKSST